MISEYTLQASTTQRIDHNSDNAELVQFTEWEEKESETVQVSILDEDCIIITTIYVDKEELKKACKRLLQ